MSSWNSNTLKSQNQRKDQRGNPILFNFLEDFWKLSRLMVLPLGASPARIIRTPSTCSACRGQKRAPESLGGQEL